MTQFVTPVGGSQSPELILELRVPACVQGTCVHGVVCVCENVCINVTGSVYVTGRVWGREGRCNTFGMRPSGISLKLPFSAATDS